MKFQYKQDKKNILYKSNAFLNKRNLSSLAVYAKVLDNGYVEIKNIYKGNNYIYDKYYKSNYIDDYIFCVIINKTKSSKPCYDKAIWSYKENYKLLNETGNEIKYILNKNYTSNKNYLKITKITNSQILDRQKKINNFNRILESERQEQDPNNKGTSILGDGIVGAIIVGTVGAAISQVNKGTSYGSSSDSNSILSSRSNINSFKQKKKTIVCSYKINSDHGRIKVIKCSNGNYKGIVLRDGKWRRQGGFAPFSWYDSIDEIANNICKCKY